MHHRIAMHHRILCVALLSVAAVAHGQSVGLPAPRLLTLMPMGGQAGTQVEVTIGGDHLEEAAELLFSDSRLVAAPKLDASGQPEANKYVVTIPADCPVGVYEARLMTRLGVSSARAFSVGSLPELVRTSPNTTLATAMALPLNSVCNGFVASRAVDHFAFEARQGQRVIVDCATRGVDSKLDAVVIVADDAGRDLVVERRGGVLDFTAPRDGRFIVKIHELTFNGGPAYFYRLGLWELAPGEQVVRQSSTRPVHACSWPPEGLPERPETHEAEPNNESAQAQRIVLPCDLDGAFFPAADVDWYEFEAKQGDEWWVEVGSERLGRPTDPTILVQRVETADGAEQVTDVVELTDIPSPVKVSSNGYAYDGPPYNAGSSDVLGKLAIPADGRYRLRLADLFGGTRSDPQNVYRLVIRRAAPDFALAAWAQHMELRNGDRNALSKPLALRGGATVALEVVAIRRDGFEGPIELSMEGLPEGVRAQGLVIAAGQTRGMMLVTADERAPRGYANAKLVGRAQVGDREVTHPCQLASMAWPVSDAWSEIPRPRLLADVPVSVSGLEYAPLTLAPPADGPLVAKAGEKVTIPLTHIRRSDFSGGTVQLRAIGAGFERAPAVDVKVDAERTEVVLDLAALKTPPGDYWLAFQGGAVAKYRHRADLVDTAELVRRQAEQELAKLDAEAKRAAADAESAPAEQQPEAKRVAAELSERQQAAAKELAAAVERVKQATASAQPKDIVDIVVSEPIHLRVEPAESP